jgi:hypothetical protein
VAESDDIDDGEDDPGYPAVVAIDPGGSTGWAILQVHPDCLTNPAQYRILDNIFFKAWGEYNGAEIDMSLQVADLMAEWEGAAFLIEDFILREFSMDRALLSPVRITSHLEWHCTTAYSPPRPVFKQNSELMLSSVTDERLKRWGLYDRHSGDHAREATKHAIIFLRRAMMDPSLRADAWPHIYGEEDHAHAI